MKVTPGFIYKYGDNKFRKCLSIVPEWTGTVISNTVFFKELSMRDNDLVIDHIRYCSLEDFLGENKMLEVDEEIYEKYNKKMAISFLNKKGWSVKRGEKFWEARRTTSIGTESRISSSIFDELFDLCRSLC